MNLIPIMIIATGVLVMGVGFYCWAQITKWADKEEDK